MLSSWLRKKPIQPQSHESALQRTLNAFDLTMFGIGAIIGAGVFVITGIAAATKGGPAIVISYVIAGIAALFAALAYTELASSIGGTGSAYSYAYTGFGEIVAWLIGWDLLLEYAMSVSTVAIGWAGYVNNFLVAINIHLPAMITKNPFEGGAINLLAVSIIIAISTILCLGIKQSARFNTAVVFIKLITIAVFILVAVKHVDIQNWSDFLPFGWNGVMQGAALVFFAYIGFDAVSTAVEETINPQRNIPIGIIGSLIGCTIIYIIVSALLTSIVSYTKLNVGSPVADALLQLGHHTAAGLIAAGAIAGLTTVILVMSYGLSRICLAIARDGLLPIALGKINLRTHTPIRIAILTGAIMAIAAGLVPIEYAAELVNIGTLAAFVFVCLGVIILRHTHPDMERPFKLPFNPILPSLGILFCLYLMLNLSHITWLRFAIWMGIGLVIYLAYGQRHSVLGDKNISK
ncbi:MAG: amino acid permease [Gammaproteobacteria bacterium RIFCSPHIGHO2_12_FULL_37_14]|nr:MAG: amino acid permease [Gammaproteobacteria bacterium RIFCSPHIGHO2_12_FULL_37_14]